MSMSNKPESASANGLWASRWIFILAAAGSAIGLGNIWKFPYITGEYGGGAFVLVYLLCVALVGMPIMVAEIVVGRRARAAPINAVSQLARESGARKQWMLLGWLGTIAGILILSYYSMIGGWALDYVLQMARGDFNAATAQSVTAAFDALRASPLTMLAWHSLFMAMTIYVVARGVNRGLENAVRWMMPLLVILLLVLVGYAATTGHFMEGARFLFAVDFSKLSGEAVLSALGHSFFTLSLGMCAIMAYGAYMPREQSIGKATLAIAGMDTAFALLAGLAIFPILFAHGLSPGQGPGLMFVTLPLAFGNLPLGVVFGTLFFILVTVAAWTSAISLAEPFVAWAVEKGHGRVRAAVFIGVVAWALGILSVLSFNVMGADTFAIAGMDFFSAIDFLATNILLPVGGLLVAVFVGWALKETKLMKELAMANQAVYIAWRIAIRIIAPLAILAVLLNFLGVF